MKKKCCLFLALVISLSLQAQEVNVLFRQVKEKISQVHDYVATGKMKTNVSFLKIPVSDVKVYFKKPNLLKVKSDQGISFIPKGSVNLNMAAILNDNKFEVIDAGVDKQSGKILRVIKLLPTDENADIVLSTLYVDPATSLIQKARNATKESGSFELDFVYGKYITYGLPDKVTLSFNTSDYKLPKGVTFDFDDGTKKKASDSIKNKKGKAEITFSRYAINQGIDDAVFKK